MSTSYTNTGGTGVRGTFVLATASASTFSNAPILVDGAFGGTAFLTAGAVASKWIQFDFSHAVVVDEALWWW
jgi:hypothetical protein